MMAYVKNKPSVLLYHPNLNSGGYMEDFLYKKSFPFPLFFFKKRKLSLYFLTEKNL